jgi:transglutaminase-like putative cysteine protease
MDTDSFAGLTGPFDLPPHQPPAAPGECLGPTDVIDAGHPSIQRQASTLTAGLDTPPDKTGVLFEFVRDGISYDFAPDIRSRTNWLASNTLARGDGFCQQKSILLAALLRAAGVPAQLGYQHLKDYKIIGTRYESGLPGGVIHYHGLVYVYLGGGWRRVDPTLDAALVNKRRYRLAEFNPQGETLLPRTDRAGQPHFDFLADFGPYPNLPTVVSTKFVEIAWFWDEWRDLVRRTGATM